MEKENYLSKRPIFTVQVEADEFTKAASTAFDYQFTGISTFEGWNKPVLPEKFGIGLIVGPSGSGKSLMLKQFGSEVQPEWNSNKAIVSHFSSPNDALDRLMAVGLNSIPSWCRPFHVLSNGEQFRANLARRLENNTVIDEFTSVVDRNVAKAVSHSLRRYVDKKGLTGLVLASCHHDILEWLRPDWYFDTIDGTLHDGRLLRRPPIEIRILSLQEKYLAHVCEASLFKRKSSQGMQSVFGNGRFWGRRANRWVRF